MSSSLTPPHGKKHQGEPSTAAPPASVLYSFIQHTILPTPDGCRHLLPFLTTNDRLRLSECCHQLADYRFYLSHVKVDVPPRAIPVTKRRVMQSLLSQPVTKRRVMQLLLSQRELEYLSIGSRKMLPVVGMLSMGMGEGLKTLDLSKTGLKGKDVPFLTWAARGGWVLEAGRTEPEQSSTIV